MDASEQECEFLHLVQDDLERYRQMSDQRSVLVFPTLPSRLRYLIHSVVDDLPELSTFSVGESWCRQVVICHSELRCDANKDKQDGKAKPQSSGRIRTPKRPDKPIYVPKVMRERHCLENSPDPTRNKEAPSPSSESPICSEEEKQSSGLMPESHDGVGGEENIPLELNPKTEGQSVLNSEENCVSSLAGLTLETQECKESNTTQDPDAEDIMEEIKQHLKEFKNISIHRVHNEYLYEDVRSSLDCFGHVIEIFDFPIHFKTEDLLDAFSEYSGGGMKIKWVDDTRALGVFSSESAATKALSMSHPLLKTCLLAKGSKKAKGKAIRQAEFIQPVRERPKTDSAVAKRLVTRALGQQRRQQPS